MYGRCYFIRPGVPALAEKAATFAYGVGMKWIRRTAWFNAMANVSVVSLASRG